MFSCSCDPAGLRLRLDCVQMLLRALFHLLVLRTPRVRRPAPPTARVARALQLPDAPDRLRLLRGYVWIAATRHIPGPPTGA